MNKTILIGVIAFGGIVLLSSLFLNKNDEEVSPDEVVQDVETLNISDMAALGVPIYPDSDLVNVNDTKQEGVRFLTLSLKAEASISQANEWYREALSQNGWTIKSDKNIGGYTIIQGESGEKYTSLQAANSDEAGKIMISQQIRIRE